MITEVISIGNVDLTFNAVAKFFRILEILIAYNGVTGLGDGDDGPQENRDVIDILAGQGGEV